MAKLLRVEEMIDCVGLMDNAPATLTTLAEAYRRQLEEIGSAFAREIADHLGVDTGPATFDHSEMGGVCAPFYAREVGQACPEALQEFDPGEWSTEDGTELDEATGSDRDEVPV